MNNNIQNFNNLYVNLAQGAYTDSSVKFPIDYLEPQEQNVLKVGNPLLFNFSQNVTASDGTLIPGGKNLDDSGVVYLQPDPTHTATKMTTVTVPKANGGYEDQTYVSKRYKKGLLTDEDAGFNAYFLTSAPSLKNSKSAYLAVRGSDGAETSNNVFLSWEGLFFML